MKRISIRNRVARTLVGVLAVLLFTAVVIAAAVAVVCALGLIVAMLLGISEPTLTQVLLGASRQFSSLRSSLLQHLP